MNANAQANEKLGPTHYRLKDWLDEDGIHVGIVKFEVVKETPKGYWVMTGVFMRWMDISKLRKKGLLKFVLKDSAKRYCYPTLELAVNSYDIRKYRQLQRLRTNLSVAELIEKTMGEIKAKTLDDFKDYGGINLGHTEVTEQIVWDY